MGLAFGLLGLAIAFEVGATALLPKAEGFHNLFWSATVVAGYALSIWLLTLVVQRMAVSTAYAIWAGVGTAAIAVIGAVFLHEPLGALRATAIGLIVAGVVLLNLQGGH